MTTFHVADLPSTEDMKSHIDKCFEKLFRKTLNTSNVYASYVCAFCDEHLLKESEKLYMTVDNIYKHRKLLEWRNTPDPENVCSDIKLRATVNYRKKHRTSSG
jgi:hypothetical protein